MHAVREIYALKGIFTTAVNRNICYVLFHILLPCRFPSCDKCRSLFPHKCCRRIAPDEFGYTTIKFSGLEEHENKNFLALSENNTHFY